MIQLCGLLHLKLSVECTERFRIFSLPPKRLLFIDVNELLTDHCSICIGCIQSMLQVYALECTRVRAASDASISKTCAHDFRCVSLVSIDIINLWKKTRQKDSI